MKNNMWIQKLFEHAEYVDGVSEHLYRAQKEAYDKKWPERSRYLFESVRYNTRMKDTLYDFLNAQDLYTAYIYWESKRITCRKNHIEMTDTEIVREALS